MTTEARMPDPIRGRWTLKPNSHPFVSATLEGPRVTELVEVVPVPDEQAIERAAEEIASLVVDWRKASEGVRSVYRAKARAVLAAALEQPE